LEQRYQAVLAEVQDGWKVTDVAERLDASRQSIHAWITRNEAGGLPHWSTAPTGPPPVPTRSRARPTFSTGHYLDNVVVFATLVDGVPGRALRVTRRT
jgi:hypothetical protein